MVYGSAGVIQPSIRDLLVVGSTLAALPLALLIVFLCCPRDLKLVMGFLADAAVCAWTLAMVMQLRTSPEEWRTVGPHRVLGQFAYVASWVSLVLHVLLAFSLVHHWSHDAAFADTERQSGFGEGIYVNYLVIVIWGIDAVWYAANTTHYGQRPRWLGGLIHVFLSFVIFNAVVIFVEPPIRWYGMVLFGLIVLCALLRNRN